jgi:amidophosphoribosyltransferase
MDVLRDESGLFAVAGHPRAARVVAAGLEALGHRGEGPRIAATDGFVLRMGEHAAGTHAIGQHGADGPDPLAIGRFRGFAAAAALAGRFTNGQALRRELDGRGALFVSGGDAELVLHQMAQSGQKSFVNRLVDALWRVEGAFSVLVLGEGRVVAVRDPRGFRPLVLGRIGAATALSSEEGAIRAVGGEVIRDVEPGEMVIIDTAVRSVAPYLRQDRRACSQEVLAIASSAARAFGRPVHSVRVALGERLAVEAPCGTADVVVGTEDPPAIALGYASRAGVPWGPTVPDLVVGRRVALVAPSFVRGDALRDAVTALRGLGAVEVHVRVASPPLRAPCAYGVAGPAADDLAASDPAALVTALQADSLAFLALESYRRVLGPGHCDGCLSGDWPVAPEADGQLPLFTPGG